MNFSGDLNSSGIFPRKIRSFVRREGRMTRAQKRALSALWAQFGIDIETAPLDPNAWFNRPAPLVLEIGFGNGESLVTMARLNPENNYLGIEVHRPGAGHLLLQAAALELTNLKVICADATDVVTQHLPDDCLDRVQIFFPDPWPKKRHCKRRLIQSTFVSSLVSKLRPSGQLCIATDCQDYAYFILGTLEAIPELSNTAASGSFVARPNNRPVTKFEQRGRALGHRVWDILFIKRH